MKYLVFSLAFLICFLANSDDLYSSNCENFGCDSTFTMESDILELPQYPGCFISMNYEWRRCGDTTEIRVRGYSISDTGACSILYDSLYPGGVTDWEFSYYVYDLLRIELVKHNFMAEYDNAPPYRKPEYECPTGQKYYSYGWKSCFKWELVPATFYINGVPYEVLIFGQVECEAEACCEETMEVCYNKTTQQLEMTRTLTNYVAGDCGDGESTNAESNCLNPCSGGYLD
jgi:hypothetical protein